MSAITTHVLDTALGRPAKDVPVVLEFQAGLGKDDWQVLAKAETGNDGRITDLLPDEQELKTGNYRLTFDTATYFAKCGVSSFYLTVIIAFEIKDTKEHYHVPLLVSPYGYSTYRGS